MARLQQIRGGASAPPPDGLRTSPEWTDPKGVVYQRGDTVRIVGRKGITFRFIEHATNDLGHEWVTVYGTQFVSVDPSKIRKAKK